MTLSLYIPTYNDSQAAIESVQSSPDWPIVVVDNASDPEHREAIASLASPRVQVVFHERNIGRVANWKFCVENFLESGATWFKMLMAGDRNCANSYRTCEMLTGRVADARLIVTPVLHAADGKAFAMEDEPAIYLAGESLRAAAINGNIWHSLSCPLIHREALLGGYSFGETCLSYCADMLFLASIAEHTPTYFMPEIVTERHEQHRKTCAANRFSLEAVAEETLVRVRCIQKAAAIEPETDQDNLMDYVRDWALSRLKDVPHGPA